jgi:nitrous oxidase accessory protein
MKRKSLVVGIILLFIVTCIIPVTAQNIEKSSQSTSRGNWLYVGGSGSGNYSKVQDAIDNASDGDTVFVYHGMYRECNISVDKGITLLGENKTTTHIDGRGYLVIFFINVSNVTVRNFTLVNTSGSGFGQAILIKKYPAQGALENFCISDCIITNDDKGIYFTYVTNISISSCHIHHNTAQSIVAESSSNIQITNCIINNNGINLGGGVSRGGSIYFVGGDSNISISNCVIYSLIDSGILVDASYCHKIHVYQNLIYNNSGNGLSLTGWNPTNTEVDVHHNSIYGNSNSGIVVEAIGTPGARIHDNNISRNGPETNMTGFEAGINVWKCPNPVTIENNTLFNNNVYGMEIMFSSGVIITRNKIIGTHKAGINVWSECNNTTIRQNIFQKNQEEGLYDNSRDSNISRNVFSNNAIGSVIGGTGVVFYRNEISNNSVGIRVLGYSQVMNNTTISTHARIFCNNLLDNNREASFEYQSCLPKRTGNIIDNNFWGRSRIFVKPIFGRLIFFVHILGLSWIEIPWVCFDKNPAQKPYDIPGIK